MGTLRSITLLLTLHLFGAAPGLAGERPNIVFFFTDDQTVSTLGCYGNPVVKTPNIDALAKRGTQFKQAFVSHPICWASRTSILTGMTARSYRDPGKGDRATDESVAVLYSDLLRQNNYRTGYYGKWHFSGQNSFKRKDHFDEMEVIGRNPFFKLLRYFDRFRFVPNNGSVAL